jgi:hypothetical protein
VDCWPLLLIDYNLPAKVQTRKENLICVGLIPGQSFIDLGRCQASSLAEPFSSLFPCFSPACLVGTRPSNSAPGAKDLDSFLEPLVEDVIQLGSVDSMTRRRQEDDSLVEELVSTECTLSSASEICLPCLRRVFSFLIEPSSSTNQ